MTPEFLHYGAATLALTLGAIGGGIGQGIAGKGIIEASDRQPTGGESNFKALIIGLSLIESGIIISLIITLMLLFASGPVMTWGTAWAELGISLAVGIAGASISIAASYPVKAAAHAISRQPFFAQKILTSMVLAQSIIEAAVIFAFVVALLIYTQLSAALTVYEGLKFLAAGLAIGLGCVGPCIGQAIFSHSACTALGKNKNAYDKIFPFTLLSQAITETPLVLCLLVSLIIIYNPINTGALFFQTASLLTAALTISLGSFGTSIGIGFTASRASLQIAQEPANYSVIVKTALLIEAFIESSVIYTMIIALLIIIKSS